MTAVGGDAISSVWALVRAFDAQEAQSRLMDIEGDEAAAERAESAAEGGGSLHSYEIILGADLRDGRTVATSRRHGSENVHFFAQDAPPPEVVEAEARAAIRHAESLEDRWGRLVRALAEAGVAADPQLLETLPFSLRLAP